MNWQTLDWSNCDPPIDDSRIEEVESALLVQFPTDFKEVVKQCHGGTPTPRKFPVVYRNGNMVSSLAVLLSFASNKSENIVKMNTLLSSQLVPGLVCIGDDGGGDFVCFNYKDISLGESPLIVYWHHETDEVSFLSTTFTEFLEMLR